MKWLEFIIKHPLFSKLITTPTASSWMGRIANAPLPNRVLVAIIKRFCASYSVDLNQFDIELKQLATFNEFFIRRYKSNYLNFRGTVSAPAEGLLISGGKVREGCMLQAKGISYRLKDLLQVDKNSRTASYVTLYLAVNNYHRVHAPFDMKVVSIKRVGGLLESVSLENVERNKNIYIENERVILEFESLHGNGFIVLVGALMVGGIYINDGTQFIAATNMGSNYACCFKKGEELGYFQMGSTVILLLDNLHFEKYEALQKNISLGEEL